MLLHILTVCFSCHLLGLAVKLLLIRMSGIDGWGQVADVAVYPHVQ
jgi:hypothetical protein